MATLIAQVTILRRGTAYDAWRDAVVVVPGQSFTETDAAEITRLVSAGAARVQ